MAILSAKKALFSGDGGVALNFKHKIPLNESNF